MTDNELLLAISDIVEKKIKAEVEPLKIDMKSMKDDMKAMETGIRHDMEVMEGHLSQRISKVEMHLEQVTDPKIQWLAENYLPAAKRFEKAAEQIESMKADIDVIKSVVREHSEKLQKIS